MSRGITAGFMTTSRLQKIIVKQQKEIERLQEHVRNLQGAIQLDRKSVPRIKKMRAALESIAKNTCCDKCQEAAMVAREALNHEND